MSATETTVKKLLLSGKKRSGKSTSADYICKTAVPGAIELAIATPLKEICKAAFLLSDEQLNDEKMKETVDPRWGITPRLMFQRVGDLFRDYLKVVLPELKNQHNIFIENVLMRIKNLENSPSPPPLIVVSDNRILDENDALMALPETKSLRIHRETGDVDSHKSELIAFECTFNIENSGTKEELYSKIDKVLASFSK